MKGPQDEPEVYLAEFYGGRYDGATFAVKEVPSCIDFGHGSLYRLISRKGFNLRYRDHRIKQ